jgi:hypothetical protein
MTHSTRLLTAVLASILFTACSSNDATGPAADASPDQAIPLADSGSDVVTSSDSATDATNDVDGGALPVPACATGAWLDAGVAPLPDAGSPDASNVDGGAPRSPDAKILFVNASNTLASMRICFATGHKPDGSDAVMAPTPALPHQGGSPYPGVPRGTGGPLPDLVDFTPMALTMFAVDASTIAGEISSNPNEKTCDQLLGMNGTGGALTLGRDFFRLGTIAQGTLARGTTFLVGARDCEAGSPQTGCASGATMGILAASLDRTRPSASAIGVQVAQLSTKLASVDAFFGCTAFASGLKLGDVSPANASSIPDLAARFAVRDGSYLSPPLPLPFLQSGATQPMQLGASSTFVVVGDPSAPAATLADGSPNPQFDGRGVHVIVVANDPTLPTF